MITRIFTLLAVLVLVSGCAGALGTAGSAGSGDSGTSGTSASSSGSAGGGDSGRARSGEQQNLVDAVAAAIPGGDDRVYFAYDSSSLDTDSRAVLDVITDFLRDNGNLRLTIEGHADERGTREYNLALGERRASAVRDYLVASGIDFSRLDTISYGKERPHAIGSNETAWQQNRRAVSLVR